LRNARRLHSEALLSAQEIVDQPRVMRVPWTIQSTLGTVLRAGYLFVVWLPTLVLVPFYYVFPTAMWDPLFRCAMATLPYSGAVTIKLAQWIASRPDVFPSHITDRLTHLQHTAPSHEWSDTEAALAEVSEPFGWVDPHQVGSGAIAQVHRGRLVDGREVAIKVLHPGIVSMVQDDLRLLRVVVGVINYLQPSMVFLGLEAGLDEFTHQMLAQLDLRQERDHLMRFGEMFADDATVSFPAPHEATRRVLVMDWQEGQLLSEVLDERQTNNVVSAEEKRRIAQTGLHLFFEMLRRDFVHGDLHAGNIFYTGPPGRVALVDCGLVVELNDETRDNFRALFAAVVRRDGSVAAREMMDRGQRRIKGTPMDRQGFEEDMAAIFADMDSRFSAGPLAGALQKVLRSAQRRGVDLDSSFVTLVTSCVVLEGTGRRLDANLSLSDLPAALLRD